MKFLKHLLVLAVGVAIGVLVGHPFKAKAQDPKLPGQLGIITLTPTGPNVKVTLFPNERYLGFSCTASQCYIATMQ